MMPYEITYISTNLIYIFTVYKLFQIFFDEETCNKKTKTILLSAYFMGLSSIIFVTRQPIVMLLLNLFFCYVHGGNNCSCNQSLINYINRNIGRMTGGQRKMARAVKLYFQAENFAEGGVNEK